MLLNVVLLLLLNVVVVLLLLLWESSHLNRSLTVVERNWEEDEHHRFVTTSRLWHLSLPNFLHQNLFFRPKNAFPSKRKFRSSANVKIRREQKLIGLETVFSAAKSLALKTWVATVSFICGCKKFACWTRQDKTTVSYSRCVEMTEQKLKMAKILLEQPTMRFKFYDFYISPETLRWCRCCSVKQEKDLKSKIRSLKVFLQTWFSFSSPELFIQITPMSKCSVKLNGELESLFCLEKYFETLKVAGTDFSPLCRH